MNKPMWIIFAAFSVIGMFFVNVVGHEIVHYLDYKDLDKNEEGICVINVPITSEGLVSSAAAYYYASYNSTDEYLWDEADKGTEVKAYSFTALVYVIYLVSVYFIMDDLFKLKALENYYVRNS